jgi:acylphosphatase
MQKHYNVIIRGKVQGVFYRASTKDKAIELGIKGYVMNMDDGSVYLEAEADQLQLDKLIQWCKRGPIGARVEHVEVKESELMNYENFDIRR